jgi:hypothetical protein
LVVGQFIGEIDELTTHSPTRRCKNSKHHRDRYKDSRNAANPALQVSDEAGKKKRD